MTLSTLRILWLTALVLVAIPAMGQKIYKCPGPDGKAVYQQKQCADGEKMQVRDNGSGSSGPAEAEAPTSTAPASAKTAPASGLRPGEQAMLDDVRRREEAERDRAAEYAKAQAIEDHKRSVDALKEQMHRDHEVRMELLRQRR
jgi:hypothetical protein